MQLKARRIWVSAAVVSQEFDRPTPSTSSWNGSSWRCYSHRWRDLEGSGGLAWEETFPERRVWGSAVDSATAHSRSKGKFPEMHPGDHFWTSEIAAVQPFGAQKHDRQYHGNWVSEPEDEDTPGISRTLSLLSQSSEAVQVNRLCAQLKRQVQRSKWISSEELSDCLRLLKGSLSKDEVLLDVIAKQVASQATSFSVEDICELALLVGGLLELRSCNGSSDKAIETTYGSLLGEAVCRPRDLDLDQLSRLARQASTLQDQCKGSVLVALLAVAGVDGHQAHIFNSNEHQVLARCLKSVEAQVGEYTPEELATVLTAFAILSIDADRVVETMLNELSCCITSLASSELALLSWTLGNLGIQDHYILEALSMRACKVSWSFTANDLAKLLFGFAALGFRQKETLDAIAEVVAWKAASFTAAGVTQIVCSFSLLSIVKNEMMVAIAMHGIAIIERFSPENLASVAWAFAKLRLRHGRLMHAIALQAAPSLHLFDEEDLARLAWAFAELDLAPPELTNLLVAEAGKRAAQANQAVAEVEADDALPEATTNAAEIELSSTGSHQSEQLEPRSPLRESVMQRLVNRRDLIRRKQASKVPDDQPARPNQLVTKILQRKADDAEQDMEEHLDYHPYVDTHSDAWDGKAQSMEYHSQEGQEDSLQPVDTTGREVEASDEQPFEEPETPSYDALLAALREQLRATHGEQLIGRLSDTQVLCRASVSDIDRGGSSMSKDDQARLLDLVEAQRLVEKAGRQKKRSFAKKKERAEKKLERDFLKTELTNAYNAQHNQQIRYYNSVAIRVHKGEKAVDVKTIASVAAAQGAQPEELKLTKEDRMMARRIA